MSKALINGILALIVVVSTAMHFPHFSKDLMSIHVWRQTQTQSTIVNFYEEDMNIFNPRRNDRGDGDGILRMEFPLMQWLVACLYKVFGNHLLITRLFMFITGLLSVLGMYKLIESLFNNREMAAIGAWTFNFSPSFYYYTINPLPDNLALCFGIWGMVHFFRWCRHQKNFKVLWVSGSFMSLAALCKLPFILYFSIPLIYWLTVLIRNGNQKKFIRIGIVFMGFIMPPLLWYGTVISTWEGNGIVKGMFDSQVSLLIFIWYLFFNLVSTLPELLLNYGSLPFFIAGFYFLYNKKAYKNELFASLAGLGVILLMFAVFEGNMIAEIHDYYLFPFYPLLFILVSYGGYHLWFKSKLGFRYLSVVLLLLLPFTAYLRMANRWSLEKPGFNRDLWTYKNELRAAVPKESLVVVGNDPSHYISFYYIDKKGWGLMIINSMEVCCVQ